MRQAGNTVPGAAPASPLLPADMGGVAPFMRSGIIQVNYTVPNIPGQSILSVVNGQSTDFAYVYVK